MNNDTKKKKTSGCKHIISAEKDPEKIMSCEDRKN